MSYSPDLASIQQARDFLETATRAWEQFKTFDQDQVDRIVKAMAEAGYRHAESLAKLAVEDTGMGRYEDKILKNQFGSKVLYESIKDMKTVGIIHKDDLTHTWEVAEPMGVVAALIPTTNPTSTALYKAIISVKSRNAIVMSPHPRAIKCTSEAAKIVAEAAYKAGAPNGLIQCMTEVSLQGTEELMKNKLTRIILATGSTAMVKAAQSTGKPAYGVGSGNVPAYIHESANVEKAVRDIVTGCSFDNGNLCSTERSLIVDEKVKSAVLDQFKKFRTYLLSDTEKIRLEQTVVPGGKLNTDTVGQSAVTIAKMAGIPVPNDTMVLVVELNSVGKSSPLSMETLSPILSMYTVKDWKAGCDRCIEILNFGGIGHTMSLHANDEKVIEAFALQKPAMRIVVNSVASLGAVGFTTGLPPSMTLGVGTWGGSITADNITPMHLLNIKRIAFETSSFTANWMGKQKQSYTPPSPSGTKRVQYQPKTIQSVPSTERTSKSPSTGSWMDQIDERIRAKAGNKPVPSNPSAKSTEIQNNNQPHHLTDRAINDLIQKYSKKP